MQTHNFIYIQLQLHTFQNLLANLISLEIKYTEIMKKGYDFKIVRFKHIYKIK